jgi:fructoselysine-6-P-deglycase FrlB-like protein
VGRPYADELAALPVTFAWARQKPIDDLVVVVENLAAQPLVIVGSGGSLSACHLVARLHEAYVRQPARVLTPYEFVLAAPDETSAVLLLSARGRNPDILAAAEHAIAAGYPLATIVASTGSLLAEKLSDCRHANAFEFDPPAGRDGFLATNSLLATAVLATRAYARAFSIEPDLPNELPAHITDGPAIDRPLLTVLGAGWSWPAVMDLESKCNESGLGAVVYTDFRNFAHGRHHGLARRAANTGVIVFSTPDSAVVAAKTLAALPAQIPKLELESRSPGAAGTIELLVQVFHLVGEAARRAGIDPGRPEVPDFGRRLYQMTIPKSRTLRGAALVDMWIERKVSPPVWTAASNCERDQWRTAYDQWASELEETRLRGVAVDFDGTVCDASERFTQPRQEVGAALVQLLDIGTTIGIATGRGGSVIDALRAVIPNLYWPSVVVGAYNGGQILTLADALAEDVSTDEALLEAEEVFRASPLLSALAQFRLRPTQLTLRQRHPLPRGLLCRVILEAVAATSGLSERVSTHESGHAVDVVPSRISKLRVVEEVAKRAGGEVLRIGDQGRLHGNDFSFLSHHAGLSVERVSAPLDRCWNVAPPGHRGTQALLVYLKTIRRAVDKSLRFSIRALERGR